MHLEKLIFVKKSNCNIMIIRPINYMVLFNHQ